MLIGSSNTHNDWDRGKLTKDEANKNICKYLDVSLDEFLRQLEEKELLKSEYAKYM